MGQGKRKKSRLLRIDLLFSVYKHGMDSYWDSGIARHQGIGVFCSQPKYSIIRAIISRVLFELLQPHSFPAKTSTPALLIAIRKSLRILASMEADDIVAWKVDSYYVRARFLPAVSYVTVK